MPELKPCPFCGRFAKTKYFKGVDYSFWRAGCNVDESNNGCSYTLGYETEQEAIIDWNKRQGEQQCQN